MHKQFSPTKEIQEVAITLSLRYVLIEQKCDEGRPCFFTYIGSQGVHGYVFKIPDVWSFLFKDIQGHGVSCTHYAILKRQ